MELRRLTDRVYYSPPDFVRDRPVMGAVLGERSTLVVEAGASPAHAAEFRSALERLGGPPARVVAVTHWHWDHVFGIAAWGLPVIAHRETSRRVAEMARLDWRDGPLDARVKRGEENPFIAEHVKIEMSEDERAKLLILPPDLIFDDRIDVDLGEVTAQVIHVGGDHSPDSSIVYIPEEQVVFLGDCLYSGPSEKGYVYTLDRLFPMLDTLVDLNAQNYLIAHEADPTPRAVFLKDATKMRRIGELVVGCRGDRTVALKRLEAENNAPLGEDEISVLEAFINGLAE